MRNKLIAPFAIFLLILSLLACGLLRNRSSYKWHLVLEVDPSVPSREAVTRDTVELLRSRLNSLGVISKVDVVDLAEHGRVRVDLPEVKDVQRLKNFLVTRGLLQLFHIISPGSPAPCQTYASEDEANAAINATSDRKVLPYPDSDKKVSWVVVALPAIVDGRDLRSARTVPNQVGNGYEINFTLKSDGVAKFNAWSSTNIDQCLAVVLNDEVKSVAYIKSQITDTGQIAGSFTKESAEDLAQILTSGPLPATLKIVEEGQN